MTNETARSRVGTTLAELLTDGPRSDREPHLKAYANASEARRELGAYFRFYNDQRPHQALGYRTPAEVFHEARNATGDSSKVTEGPPERGVGIIGMSSGTLA